MFNLVPVKMWVAFWIFMKDNFKHEALFLVKHCRLSKRKKF